MRHDLSQYKDTVDIALSMVAEILEANDNRIERALRTLLAAPGNPHSGAGAALEDLNDRSAVAGLAEAAAAALGE